MSRIPDDVNVVNSNIPIVEQTLINSLALTDTTTHSILTDPTLIFQVAPKSGRKVIGVQNTLNQAVSVSVIFAKADGTKRTLVGTAVSVPASATKYITSSDVAPLVEPVSKIDVQVACTTAPTSGSVTAWVSSRD